MPNFLQLAQNYIQNNMRTNIQAAPWVLPAAQAVMNGDAKTGEAIANNLLSAYGITKEQAMEIARQKGLI